MGNESPYRTQAIVSQAEGDIPEIPQVDWNPSQVEPLASRPYTAEAQLIPGRAGVLHDAGIHRAEWIRDRPHRVRAEPGVQHLPRAAEVRLHGVVIEPRESPMRRPVGAEIEIARAPVLDLVPAQVL